MPGRSTRSISGIEVRIIDTPVAFNFHRAGVTYGHDAPFCFLLPGQKTRLNVQSVGMTALDPYGSAPDYSVSRFELEPAFKQTGFATVEARLEAEPGERLILARGPSGTPVQAGLIGLQVATKVPERLSGGSVKEIEDAVRR